jgi:hypothetical protein
MLLIAAVLALAIVVILFLPPVRSTLLARVSHRSLRVVSLAALGPEGVPLEKAPLWPIGDGLPTGNGRALFWMSRANPHGAQDECLLVRLPDCRVVAKTYGFSQVAWCGNEAVGVVVKEKLLYRLPLVRDLLARPADSFTITHWILDWRSGGMRPEGDDSFLTWQSILPEAHEFGRYTLECNYDPDVSPVTVSLAGKGGGNSRTVCTLPRCDGCPWMCVTGSDSAIVVLTHEADPNGPYFFDAYELTVSTGQLEKLPLESTDTTAAKP